MYYAEATFTTSNLLLAEIGHCVRIFGTFSGMAELFCVRVCEGGGVQVEDGGIGKGLKLRFLRVRGLE